MMIKFRIEQPEDDEAEAITTFRLVQGGRGIILGAQTKEKEGCWQRVLVIVPDLRIYRPLHVPSSLGLPVDDKGRVQFE